MRDEAQRKVTMTVFLCLCIQLIAFMLPLPRPLFREKTVYLICKKQHVA